MPSDDDDDKANDDAWSSYEDERLHRAAASGDIADMARLVEAGHDIARFDDMERTPLHHAAEAGQFAAAAWLIARGADVNAYDEARIGETALCLAIQKSRPEMVELLLRHGADPDMPGWMCLTARDRVSQRKREPGLTMQALIARYAPRVGAHGKRRL